MHILGKKIHYGGVAVVLIVGAFIFFHLFLISKTFFEDDQGNFRAAYAGYGDIPFHMTQISKFAFSSPFDLSEPLFLGDKIKYHFLMNWVSGWVMRATGDWTIAMHLPSMLMVTASSIFAYLWYRRLLDSRWMATMALFIFFLGSGLGGYQIAKTKIFDENLSPGQFMAYLTDNNISTINRWDAKYPDQNLAFGAPLSMGFLHQRAFFLGFFLFTLFLYLFEKWKTRFTWSQTVALGIVVGLGPFAHYHSFIAMALVLGLTFVWHSFQRNREMTRRLAILGGIIAIIALPQIIYGLAGAQNVAFSEHASIKFHWGWMTEPTIGSVAYGPWLSFPGTLIPFALFLWVNFGLILPLFIAGAVLVVAKKKRFPRLQFAVIVALAFFALAQLIRFQPWDFDNNKLLVYFLFFVAPVIVFLFQWLQAWKKGIGVVLTVLFFIGVVFSGILDQVPRVRVTKERVPVIFDRQARELGEFVRFSVDSTVVILTGSGHLNPIVSLAGRPVLVGYPGWLWTRGIDFGAREGEIKRFYQNPADNMDVVQKYDASYILFDAQVANEWKAVREPFDQLFPVVMRGDYFTLYRVE